MQTIKRTTDKLIRIIANTDTLWATPTHPFYTNNGWVEAQDLNKESILISKSVNKTINSTVSIDTIATVYNFEVADFHTYFVGNGEVLVHNGDDCFGDKYFERKDLRTEVYNAERPTAIAHKDKHIKAKTDAEAIQLSKSGEASYKPEFAKSIKEFEKNAAYQAIKKENVFEHGGATYYFYKHSEVVGFNNGIPTNWIRIEISSGTIHSFPAGPLQLKGYKINF